MWVSSAERKGSVTGACPRIGVSTSKTPRFLKKKRVVSRSWARACKVWREAVGCQERLLIDTRQILTSPCIDSDNLPDLDKQWHPNHCTGFQGCRFAPAPGRIAFQTWIRFDNFCFDEIRGG